MSAHSRSTREVDVQTNKRSASSFRFVHFASFNCSFVFLVSCPVEWSLYSPMRVVSSQKRLYHVSVYCLSEGKWTHFAHASARWPSVRLRSAILARHTRSSAMAPARSTRWRPIWRGDMGAGLRRAARGWREFSRRRHLRTSEREAMQSDSRRRWALSQRAGDAGSGSGGRERM